MPRVRTKNGHIIEFRYELAIPKGDKSPTELVRITPEGNNLTVDQARVALITYDEVERVIPRASAPPVSDAPLRVSSRPTPPPPEVLACPNCSKEYKTQRGLDKHILSHTG